MKFCATHPLKSERIGRAGRKISIISSHILVHEIQILCTTHRLKSREGWGGGGMRSIGHFQLQHFPQGTTIVCNSPSEVKGNREGGKRSISHFQLQTCIRDTNFLHGLPAEVESELGLWVKEVFVIYTLDLNIQTLCATHLLKLRED